MSNLQIRGHPNFQLLHISQHPSCHSFLSDHKSGCTKNNFLFTASWTQIDDVYNNIKDILYSKIDHSFKTRNKITAMLLLSRRMR